MEMTNESAMNTAAAVAELLRRGEVLVDERLAVGVPSAEEIEQVSRADVVWIWSPREWLQGDFCSQLSQRN